MAITVSTTRPVSSSLGTRLHGWVTTVDHKRIGLMYLMMSLVFLIVGGLEAMLIRLPLWTSNNTLVDADTFNQLFTMHGTTMIFFVVMPMIAGFANYFVPLMIGTRDVAFPRLNAFGFWLSLFGGSVQILCLFGSIFMLAIGCGKPKLSQRFVRPADVTDFPALFSKHCSGCHGGDGQCGPAPPLNDPLFQALVSDSQLADLIRQGRA